MSPFSLSFLSRERDLFDRSLPEREDFEPVRRFSLLSPLVYREQSMSMNYFIVTIIVANIFHKFVIREENKRREQLCLRLRMLKLFLEGYTVFSRDPCPFRNAPFCRSSLCLYPANDSCVRDVVPCPSLSHDPCFWIAVASSQVRPTSTSISTSISAGDACPYVNVYSIIKF